MWQNLRLQTKDQNQFLGDMFEYFLDNSIKQSEGQFFTPVPICKFIVSSLPLETSLKNKAEPLKAIDYACGAGHFLNEYALQIKPLVEKHKKLDKSAYFGEIYGIEKEDRLAKIAKISAFMYGQDEINIIDSDALDEHQEIKPESFDVLVANPPFAVEGFLETLPEEQREKYELIKTVNDLNNNNIQCFFIERAKQLLAPNAVAGFIVPSSVLSNSDKTHVASREILLKYFDIVAIAELGGGTFGKTGTNTVVMFIRRKSLKPEPAEHYKNRVDDFFEGIKEGDKDLQEYQDLYLIRAYCEQIEVNYEEYKKLLNAAPDKIGELDALFEHEIFKDYKTDFEKSTEIKNLKNKPQFRNKSAKEKQNQLNKLLIRYLQKIEKDKLYYFILAYNNPCKVLIVKSPTDNKELKQFLGYEWKGAKGQEGIKYNGGEIISDIITPMFDPKNPNNADKINYYIQQNFDGNEIDTPNKYISYHKLIDLLDFSRKDFSKTFSLNTEKKRIIETQWEIKKLSEFVEIISGGTPDTNKPEYWNGDIPWLSVVDFNNAERFVSKTEKTITELGLKNSSTKYLQPRDVIISARGTVGALAQLSIPMTFNQSCYGLRAKPEKIDDGYLYYILKQEARQFKESATGVTFGAITMSSFDGVKIPLPPLETQTNIVRECESIDAEVTQAQTIIEQAKAAIDEKIENVYQTEANKIEIGRISTSVQYGLNEAMNELDNGYKIFRMNEIISGRMFDGGKMKYADISPTEFAKCKLYQGDILFNRTNSLEHVGKTGIFTLEGDYCYASYLIRVVVNREIANPSFVNLLMNSKTFQTEAKSKASKAINQANINAEKMKAIKIPVPPLPTQEKLVAEITKLEAEISEARKIIESSAERKQAVMKKYL